MSWAFCLVLNLKHLVYSDESVSSAASLALRACFGNLVLTSSKRTIVNMIISSGRPKFGTTASFIYVRTIRKHTMHGNFAGLIGKV